ncbi:hypothetical protein G6F56_000043 [Rhizopus delemar]|uniref:BHLH domain-containing protein n=1 Tax=Rhizopus stolonifer TaxID=4846 RepID=A0A367KXM0_RHIST|nr:hypothetical protein G6F56_000043 [Rhizopus delemar]RCI06936.1 hypothetical protein CU098_013922 [Rhizopus stolonifer]
MSQQSLTTTVTNNTNTTDFQSNFNLTDPSMNYTGSEFYVSPLATGTAQSSTDSYFYDTPVQTFATSPKVTISPSSIMIQEPPMLVASSSTTTTASTMSSSSVEFLNEAFAKATSLPESFYPEFLQYSKETYEQSTGGGPQRRKQNRNDKKKDDDGSDEDTNQLSSSELRRQIHIQSEQKRRAQIKDGFEELRNELPACLNKKMSKVALLHRTVQHIQHLKETQMSILSELERLVHENEQLRKFQENVLQKQALENMYNLTA